ncbi:MAG: MBL fold metallo-hydrolase [Clostridiales bacterium]|nr:MBL fold metallo-hydrolase [Clostridiales bacterium]
MKEKIIQECYPEIYEYTLHNPTSTGIAEIHIYLIPGGSDGRSLMIDAGFAGKQCLNDTLAVLDECKIAISDLDVFLTHEHHDHSGLASALYQRGARIFMNPEEESHHYTCLYHHQSEAAREEQISVLCTVGVTPELTPELWRWYLDEMDAEPDEKRRSVFAIGDFRFEPIYAGQIFRYGNFVFHAFGLRGHTAGQMGLYDEGHKVVFTADQVINHIAPIVSTSYEGENSLSSYFDSLQMIKRRFRGWTILPAHAGPITDLSGQIEYIAESYLDKLDIISHIVNESERPLTVCETAFQAYGIHGVGDSRRFLLAKTVITKTFSCLEYLYQKGFVRKERREGVLLWMMHTGAKGN